MSETSNPSALILHENHYHQQQTPNQPAASQPTTTPTSPSSSTIAREYRKGNWTLHETLILITAKRQDEERRTIRHCSGGGATTTPRSAELRWKWVENYCWNNGCLRSQNQCNDKWDNLLRDYKKLRDYDSCSSSGAGAGPSYWAMEKHERKDRNLPSNLSSEVFDALTNVLNRRNAHRGPPPPPLPPPQQSPPPPPPPPPPSPPPPPQPPASVEASGSSDSEGNAGSGSEAKRRRARGLGRSVERGASVLARTLLACEERRDKRHRELVELEERRLRTEEERMEITRQGIAGIIAAVNGLSGAINALVADSHRPPG